jgi:two-component system chemotaxis response regulator CheB
MAAIKRCGGIVIVQDPIDAEHSELPLNVLDKVEVDHCLPLNRIPEVLEGLLSTAPTDPPAVPPDLAMEARISMRAVGGVDDISAWGAPSFVTCPECGGALWENSSGTVHRFRCHTGHTFGPDSLDAAQAGKIEQTLWIALRLFQEKHETLKKFAGNALGPQWDSMHQRIAEIEGHIRRTKEMLGII